MTIIDITSMLSPDLRFRSSVPDLLAFVRQLEDDRVQIDFSRVKFATRNFIDEYYNTFFCENSNLGGVKVETINIPDDIKYMLNVVSKTQSGRKLYEEPLNTSIRHFSNLKELAEYLGTITV